MTSPNDSNVIARPTSAMLEHYRHRLVSLQAELREGFAQGEMDRSDFDRRNRKLESALNALGDLEKSGTGSTEESTERDLGLPIHGAMTPAEVRQCFYYLKRRAKFLRKMAAEAKQVERWVDRALHGRSLWFLGNLRLAKLRQFIRGHDVESENMKALQSRQAAAFAKLAQSIPGQHGRSDNPLTLMVDVFKEIDRLIGKVGRLRSELRQAKSQSRQMDSWLASQRSQLNTPHPPLPPPSPAACQKTISAARPTLRKKWEQSQQQMKRVKRSVIAIRELEDHKRFSSGARNG